MEVDILKFVPKRIDHRDIFVEFTGDLYKLNCNKIRPPSPIKLRKKIKINKNLLEIVGLYFGDGANSKSGSGNRRVALANSCVYLQRFWIQFLNDLGIKKEQLYFQIQVGNNNLFSDAELLSYWKNNLDVDKRRFCNISVKKDTKTIDYGLIVVNFHNKLFREIFDNIFSFCLNICKRDRSLAASFLRGLFAAEGYVHLNKYGSLAWLDIPVKDNKRRRYVGYLFDYLGIKVKSTNERILITSYLNFKKCDSINLCDLHPNKLKNFEMGLNHLVTFGKVPILSKLKIIASISKYPKTRFQIAEENDLSISVVHKALRDLEIKKAVERVGKIHIESSLKPRDLWFLKDRISECALMKRDY